MSNSATAAIAIAAAAVAALALVAALLAWIQLKRVRSSQQVMLGGGKDDLVDFAVSLQGRIDDLHRAVDEIAAGLARVDRRRPSVRHGAVCAGAGADVSEDHERGRAMVPAFPDVRTPGFFADRVKIELAHQPFEPEIAR